MSCEENQEIKLIDAIPKKFDVKLIDPKTVIFIGKRKIGKCILFFDHSFNYQKLGTYNYNNA